MALQASGPIRFSDIQNEFGAAPNKNLGAYALQENYGNLNLTLDTEIPSSTNAGIKFSDFYGKRQRIVVDFYSDDSAVDPFRKNAKTRYGASNGAYVVGRTVLTTSLPSSTSGKRVIIHVNKQFGSANGNRNYAALKTGTWDSDTEVQVIIGPSGGIYGAGGKGGNGGGPGNGENGGTGSSALGLQYPTTIINQGVIVAGRGGGGGGGVGGGYEYNNVQSCNADLEGQPRAGGGGGGGGRGYPGGSGGLGNNYSFKRNNGPVNTVSQNGQSGTISNNGSGGSGSVNIPNDQSCPRRRNGVGGSGGSGTNSGNGGVVYTNDNPIQSYLSTPGQAGTNGYAIIRSESNYILGTSPSVDGDIVTGTVE